MKKMMIILPENFEDEVEEVWISCSPFIKDIIILDGDQIDYRPPKLDIEKLGFETFANLRTGIHFRTVVIKREEK